MENPSKALEAIQQCKEKNGQLLLIFFQEKVKSDDVTELVHTSQKVNAILARILSNKKQLATSSLSFKIFQRSLDKLDAILNEYQKCLLSLEESGQLNRVLNNANLRRNVEQLNSALL